MNRSKRKLRITNQQLEDVCLDCCDLIKTVVNCKKCSVFLLKIIAGRLT